MKSNAKLAGELVELVSRIVRQGGGGTDTDMAQAEHLVAELRAPRARARARGPITDEDVHRALGTY